jgi:general secretion pathway protein A
MYKDFFGLGENPFGMEPNPRYLVLTPGFKKAMEQLTYGIQTRKALMLLTGEGGTGKTMLLNGVLGQLDRDETPVAFIHHLRLDVNRLYEVMLAGFGVKFGSPIRLHPVLLLKKWIFECDRLGKNPVLMVDEAQRLPFDVLEEIRMLLNLETPQEKKFQVLLCGQAQLEEALRHPGLRGLKQRIGVRSRTCPFDVKETHQYIWTRLRIAGSRTEHAVFSREAMNAVHSYSRGIPRVINTLCEHALIRAYVDEIRPIPARVVAEVADEFQYDPMRSPVPVPAIDEQDSEPPAAEQLMSDIAALFDALKQFRTHNGAVARVNNPNVSGFLQLSPPLSVGTEAKFVPQDGPASIAESIEFENTTKSEVAERCAWRPRLPAHDQPGETHSERRLPHVPTPDGIQFPPLALREIRTSSVYRPKFDLLPQVNRWKQNCAKRCRLVVSRCSAPPIMVASLGWLRQPIEVGKVLSRSWSVYQDFSKEAPAALFRWLQEPIDPVKVLCQSWLAFLDVCKEASATFFFWLREPFDPTQRLTHLPNARRGKKL